MVGAAEPVEAEPSSLGARTEVDPPVNDGSRPRTPTEDCRRLGESARPAASPPPTRGAPSSSPTVASSRD